MINWKHKSTHMRESKTVLDSEIHAMDSGFFVCGTGIPDFDLKWDFGLLELHSRFQSPRFWIPRAKISRIPESVFPYMGRYKLSQKSVTSFRLFSKSNLALCNLVPLCSHLAFSFRQKKAEKGLLVSKFYLTRENGKSEKSLRRVGVPTVSDRKRTLLWQESIA